MRENIKNAIEHLSKGGLILYPTDTVWGIGCDATNEAAVAKVFTLKQRSNKKALVCLVSDDRMLKKYVKEVPEAASDISSLTLHPTTIIYDAPQHLAANLIGSDNTIAIRIPNHEFCFQLLRKFNKPIVSTSANISTEPTPKSFKEISNEILKGVDYVVNLPNEKLSGKPSSIIKLSNDGTVKIIRE